VCVYVCVCVWVGVLCVSECVHVCECEFACVCVRERERVYMYMYVRMYVYIGGRGTVSACLLQTDAAKTATTKALSNTLAARDAELGRLKSVLNDLRAEVRYIAYCHAAIRPHTLVARPQGPVTSTFV
jgi:hypothetical protein